ncbi:MAG: GGDEF domain-containing protein [Burkholderiales bacterium]|nr:GGDEF domain-containing protein [Burkholderiales bacterium]
MNPPRQPWRHRARCGLAWLLLAGAAAVHAQHTVLPEDDEIDAVLSAAPAGASAAATGAPAPAAALALYQQAVQAPAAGGPDGADAAQAALAALEAHCAGSGGAAPDCEYRRRWRLQLLLAAAAREAGEPDHARGHARAALELARAGNDPWRQAFGETELALLARAQQDADGARRHLARAQHLAGGVPDARLSTRLLLVDAALAGASGEAGLQRRVLERALAAARQVRSPQLQALAWHQLAELALRAADARAALQAATLGLTAARAAQDTRLGRDLRGQVLRARAALGQHAQARNEFEDLLAEWASEGATAAQVALMRSYGDALADAGQLAAALALVHRERALSQQRKAAEREAVLAALRTRYDREAQQRNILQLERDNALKSAELANQALTQRLWALGGGVLALALGLLLLLLLRARRSNRRLARRHASLREQSERDALTGLANRRCFQAVLQAGQRAADFRGALLMIDIDHFKHINDQHGHGAGDAVLVEVARRVQAVVHEADTVARWGGEEFLVFSAGLERVAAEALAQRLLQAVAGTPVALPDGGALPVAVSIGHAVFPLPPHGVTLSAEQAVNLVDMALYTAKSQGRNRAVGIEGAEAADAEGLRRLEGDFDRAWQEGRVQLRIDAGPPPWRGAASPHPQETEP